MVREKNWHDYWIKWNGLCEEWERILYSGADAIKLTDGQMLNGVRNRMRYFLSDMEADGFSLEGILKEADANHYTTEKTRRSLPPEMPNQWMKDGREKIERNAKAALAVYQGHGDYLYVKENLPALKEYEDAAMIRKIEELTVCVRRLEYAIKYGRMADMKEYANMDRYLPKIEWAKELLTMYIDDISPF